MNSSACNLLPFPLSCYIQTLPPSFLTAGHRPSEYNVVGFSPCGEYVAHESSKPCDVINWETLPGPTDDLHICTCRTDSCPCGEFISHKIIEVCTAKL